MKLTVESPKLEISVVNDAGEVVAAFYAENYSVVLDTEAGIKAAREIAEQITALMKE